MARTKQQQTPKEEIHYIYPEDVNPEDAYLNKTSCYDPIMFHEKNCPECTHVKNCVYMNKYKYKK